jgi:hypothetical protein
MDNGNASAANQVKKNSRSTKNIVPFKWGLRRKVKVGTLFLIVDYLKKVVAAL